MRDVHAIPAMGDIVLKGIEEAGAYATDQIPTDKKGNVNLAQFVPQTETSSVWYEVSNIKTAIHKGQNIVLKTLVVKQICDKLVDAGYLSSMRDGTTWKYKIEDKFTEFDNPDFNRMLDAAKVLVKEKYPNVYQKWLDRQVLPYIHPITGEEVVLNK